MRKKVAMAVIFKGWKLKAIPLDYFLVQCRNHCNATIWCQHFLFVSTVFLDRSCLYTVFNTKERDCFQCAPWINKAKTKKVYSIYFRAIFMTIRLVHINSLRGKRVPWPIKRGALGINHDSFNFVSHGFFRHKANTSSSR